MNGSGVDNLIAALPLEKAAALRLAVYATFAIAFVLIVSITAVLLVRSRRRALGDGRGGAKGVSRARAVSAWEVAGRRAPSPAGEGGASTLSTGDTVDLDPDDPGSTDIGPEDVGPGERPR